MATAGKLIVGATLIAGAVVGSATSASAAPTHDVLCEKVAGGEIPVDLRFATWGCEMTHAPASGKDRLYRVADNTGVCARKDFLEFEFDLGPNAGGRRAFVVCLTG